MTYIIIASIIICVCLGYLAYFLVKKFPEIKNIDISTLPQKQQSEAKTKILEANFSRNSKKVKERLNEFIGPKKSIVTDFFSRFKTKIIALEERYVNIGAKAEEKKKTIAQLFEEAKSLIAKEEYPAAEKLMIEIIAKDKKNIKAYENLGRIYFETKSYDQAEEIFLYLLRLHMSSHKEDKKVATVGFKKGDEEFELDFLSKLGIDTLVARYYDDLGRVYEVTDKADKSIDCYLKATVIEPNNPKYLSKLTELAIKVGDRGLAKKTFNRLKEINPENGKLKQLFAAIEKIK